MFYAPKHFYNDEKPRGYLTWEKIQLERQRPKKFNPNRDYIDVSAPTELGRVTMRQIIDATLKAFNSSPGELVGPCREKHIVRMRHASWRVARKWTAASTVQIGKLWRRDHSTIVHGLKCVGRHPHLYAGLIAAIERELQQMICKAEKGC